MKLFAMILITFSAGLIGIFKAKELKKQAAMLSETITLLEIMRNEICTRRTPLNQLFCKDRLPDFNTINHFICKLYDSMQLLYAKNFSKIWEECVSDCLNFISKNSRQSLIMLGSSIGRYDAELQGASIDRCINELEREYKSIYINLKSNERMYIGLGTGIGLILSIILI